MDGLFKLVLIAIILGAFLDPQGTGQAFADVYIAFTERLKD